MADKPKPIDRRIECIDAFFEEIRAALWAKYFAGAALEGALEVINAYDAGTLRVEPPALPTPPSASVPPWDKPTQAKPYAETPWIDNEVARGMRIQSPLFPALGSIESGKLVPPVRDAYLAGIENRTKPVARRKPKP